MTPFEARLTLIRQYTPADPELITPLLADCERRAAALRAYAAGRFEPALLPATAWVSPLHPPLMNVPPEEQY